MDDYGASGDGIDSVADTLLAGIKRPNQTSGIHAHVALNLLIAASLHLEPTAHPWANVTAIYTIRLSITLLEPIRLDRIPPPPTIPK